MSRASAETTARQAAQTLTQQAGGKTTRFGTDQVNSLNPILPFIWMNGGDIFDNDEHPTKSTASNPAAVDAIQWMADLLTKDHAAPGPDGVKQLLTNQWGVPAIKQLATEDYVKLAPPPASRSLIVDTIDHARPLPMVTQMLQLYSQVYGKWLGDAVAGKVTAKEACAQIDQLVNAALMTK